MQDVVEDNFIEVGDQVILAGQVEAESVQGEGGKLHVGLAIELEAESGHRLGRRLERRRKRRRLNLRRHQLHRPQRDWIAGAKLARHVTHRLRVQPAATVDDKPFRQLRPTGIQVKLDDRHRRNRRQVVRVENAQNRAGQLGEFIVELVVDAPGQERKGFDQPFDVRICAASRLQEQSPRSGRVLLGELLGQLPNEQQLALIIRIKCFAHFS